MEAQAEGEKWIEKRFHVAATKRLEADVIERMGELEKPKPTEAEMEDMWRQRRHWIRLIRPEAESKPGRNLVRVSDCQQKIQPEELQRLLSHRYPLVYVIHG